MADDWKFEGLERRVDRLEKRLDEKDRKSWERTHFWLQVIIWTFVVVYVTALVVLAITHNLHNR
jgi:anti-sigma-K factor RskA